MADTDGLIQFEVVIPKGELLELAGNTDAANHSGLQRVAEATQKIAERQVGRIRKRKVPTRREAAEYRQGHRKRVPKKDGSFRAPRELTASSEPLWEPTGELAKAVSADPVFEGLDAVAIYADTPYAEPRHDLGVTWTPVDPALGIIRENPFFQETVELMEPQFGELYADGFNDEWEK